MKLRHIAAIGTAISLSLAASSSWAVSYTVLGHSSNGAGNTADVFAGSYGGYTPAGASWTAFVMEDGSSAPVVTPPPGSSPDNFLSPFANTDLENKQSYFSVGGSDGENGGQSTVATLNFSDPLQDSFGFLWGSIDSYNSMEFTMGDNSVHTFTGTDIADFLNAEYSLGLTANNGNYDYVALLSFTGFDQYDGLTKIVFRSSQSAFEFGLAPIPLPASVLFLFGGLGGLGGLRLLSRRSRTATA